MTVEKLIEILKTMPQDASVQFIYDGSSYGEIENVWLARSGNVCTTDYGSVVYYDDDRPIESPTKKENEYWRAPESSHASNDEDF